MTGMMLHDETRFDETLHDETLLRRVERVHYHLLAALFLNERHDLPGASLFFAEGISDAEYNHAALLDLDAAELPERLAALHQHFHQRDRPIAITVSPFSRPGSLTEHLLKLGYAAGFRQTWHFAPDGALPAAELPGSATIDVVRSEEQMTSFIEVFEDVYAVDPERGEPQEIEAGYARCFRESLRARGTPCEVVHYLATVDGTPAGVCTSVHGRRGEAEGISGLYNLAVRPAFRRRGLGEALVRRRAADARALGQEIVFVQSERDAVERRHAGYGFVKGFMTRCLIRERTPERGNRQVEATDLPLPARPASSSKPL